MLVEISKHDYVEIMSKRPYMDCYSRLALEKIFDIEEELSLGEKSEYSLDGAAIRGTYTEYESIKAALKDLHYKSIKELERNEFGLYSLGNGNVLIMR